METFWKLSENLLNFPKFFLYFLIFTQFCYNFSIFSQKLSSNFLWISCGNFPESFHKDMETVQQNLGKKEIYGKISATFYFCIATFQKVAKFHKNFRKFSAKLWENCEICGKISGNFKSWMFLWNCWELYIFLSCSWLVHIKFPEIFWKFYGNFSTPSS